MCSTRRSTKRSTRPALQLDVTHPGERPLFHICFSDCKWAGGTKECGPLCPSATLSNNTRRCEVAGHVLLGCCRARSTQRTLPPTVPTACSITDVGWHHCREASSTTLPPYHPSVLSRLRVFARIYTRIQLTSASTLGFVMATHTHPLSSIGSFPRREQPTRHLACAVSLRGLRCCDDLLIHHSRPIPVFHINRAQPSRRSTHPSWVGQSALHQ